MERSGSAGCLLRSSGNWTRAAEVDQDRTNREHEHSETERVDIDDALSGSWRESNHAPGPEAPQHGHYGAENDHEEADGA